MIYPYQIVATFGISFLLGVLVASYFAVPVTLLLIGAFLFVVPLLFKPGSLIKIVAVAGVGLLLGWWRYELVIDLPSNLISNWVDQTVAVQGKVASDPEQLGSRQQFQFKVDQVEGRPSFGKILLTTWPLPVYRYGDGLEGKVAISAPTVSYDFDYAAYLRKDGVYALGNVIEEITVLQEAGFSLLGSLYQLKHWLAEKVNQFLPDPHNALMNGLLLGIRTQMSDKFKNALKYSGTTHIIALSGFNVTIVAGFFLYLLRRAPRRWGLVLAAVGVLLFVLMTGASSSVVRAAIMGWIMLLAALWGRRRSIANAVIVAAAVMVAINPYVLQYDVGFQLSVAATVGLIFFTPRLLLLFQFIPTVLKEVIATSAGAIVATLPLIVFHFGGFSLVALAANALVVPLVPITMFLGFSLVLVFALLPFLQFLNLIVLGATGLLTTIINFFGNFPYSFIEVPQLPPILPVVYYLLLIIAVYYWRSVRTHKV